jgi:hypothetical protein
MEIELEPPQPEEVVRAVVELLSDPGRRPEPDPWWQAGVEEPLDA